MLGLQGTSSSSSASSSSSSSKVYRCMACSSTFTGLASLLVHQATHAAALPSKPSPAQQQHPQLAHRGETSASHQQLPPALPPASSAIVLFESPSDSLYICDCGDEFKDFNLMLEHKRVHLSNPHLLRPRGADETAPPLREGATAATPPAHPAPQQQQQLQQRQAAAELGGTSLTGTKTEPDAEEDAPAAAAPLEQSKPPSPRRPAHEGADDSSAMREPALDASRDASGPVPDISEVVRRMSDAVQEMSKAMQDVERDASQATRDAPEATRDVPADIEDATESARDSPESVQDGPDATREDLPSCDDPTDSVPATAAAASASVSKGDHLPKSNNFMKLLATAYMRRFPHDEKQPLVPKAEPVPVEIKSETPLPPGAEDDPPSPASQLRQLLKKPKSGATKTKSPGLQVALDSSTKSIVSLTKSFSPVVLLETRQTLVDPSAPRGAAPAGNYQCGRCRRVFRDVDALTEHHAMHRKERIKCCRHCKKLIIGKMPFPDNHVCPQLSGKTAAAAKFAASSSATPGAFAQLRLQNQKRVFFCPTCKHSYARRYNLKMHKCRVPAPPRAAAAPAHQKQTRLTSIQNGGNNNRVPGVAELPILGISKSVGTEMGGGGGRVKVEQPPPSPDFSDSMWSSGGGAAKAFPPAEHAAVEGQWTVPLGDDSMEALSEGDLAELVEGEEDDDVEEIDDGEEGGPGNAPLPFFVSNGVRRYPCSRCQKTYSRQATLRRHLMLCGTRQAPSSSSSSGPGGAAVQHFFGAVPSKAQQQQQQQFGAAAAPNPGKPMFDCYVCGKSFNRKDNMLVHRNKCEQKRTVTSGGGSANKSQADGGGEGGGGDGNNWGIMSLPSVLPRRVTCECGMGFTSPRLLLEHLQKHAQENYTCPTCGETVGSWSDYEVHLQIHMHPHHQLYPGGPQPRRSQPLLLRFQQQPSPSPSRQPPPPPPPAPPKQQQQQIQLHRPPPPTMKSPGASTTPRPTAASNHRTKPRFACTRCSNTFSSSTSLRRHVTLNRCKGGLASASSSSRLSGASGAVSHAINNHHNQPRTNHCSRCGAVFPSTIALVFHQRSGACSGAAAGAGVVTKPMRCHACARWFATPQALQKHMAHHHPSSSSSSQGGGRAALPYRCDVCDGSYPSLKSLKNHRRRVHRIMAGDAALLLPPPPRPKLERLLAGESL